MVNVERKEREKIILTKQQQPSIEVKFKKTKKTTTEVEIIKMKCRWQRVFLETTNTYKKGTHNTKDNIEKKTRLYYKWIGWNKRKGYISWNHTTFTTDCRIEQIVQW